MIDRYLGSGIAEVEPEIKNLHPVIGKTTLRLVGETESALGLLSSLRQVEPLEIEPIYIADPLTRPGEQLVIPRWGRGYPGVDEHTIICCRGLSQIRLLRDY